MEIMEKGQNIVPKYAKNNSTQVKICKKEWLERQCAEIEELDKQYDTFKMRKKIIATSGLYKLNVSGKIQDSKGNIIVDRLGKTSR